MSPYENRLANEDFRRVGLIALVRRGSEAALADGIKSTPAAAGARLAAVQVANLNLFMRSIGERTFLFAFLEFRGVDVESVAGTLRGEPWLASLAPYLEPHPRATSQGSPWLRMELMNVLGPTLPAPAADRPIARLGLMSGLKPASELWYRTLHQTNWPGVVDQMGRSHFRYWVTFLIEFGEELFLFTYCEYVGTDKSADDALMAADPVTQRWWKHTEPCLIALAPGGSWTPMTPLLRVG
jgi:L-rhamnose mutarotase